MSSSAATSLSTSSTQSGSPLPAGAERMARMQIDGTIYPVRDLSAGSCVLTNVRNVYAPGHNFNGTLLLPAGYTPSSYALHAIVESVDAAAETLVCRFDNIPTAQIAQLNDAVKKLANQKDGAAANPAGAALAPSATPKAAYTRRQIIGLSVAGLLGLTALAVIAANIYEGVFVVRAPRAVVTGATLDVRATQDGIFNAILPADTATVQKGQPIGEMRPFATANAAEPAVQTLFSPCDCVVVGKAGVSNDSVLRGETLLTLVSVDDKPMVTAELVPDDAAKIKTTGKITFNVVGSDMDYDGKITAIHASMGQTAVPGATLAQAVVTVDIAPAQTLPVDFIGRPARVTFNAR